MDWIETIHLRAGNINEYENVVSLFNPIKASLEQNAQVVIKLYKDIRVLSDFTIVFEWNHQDLNANSTPLKSAEGIRLAESLSKLGLVNHTIFVEEKVK